MLFINAIIALQEVLDLKECTNTTDLNLGMIASIGDSVLAGYGSRQFTAWPFFNPLNFREDRGATAVSGGDPDMWSMFRMAKYFNPDLQGESTGTHWINLCRGVLCVWPFNMYRKNDGLNVAETGAFTSDTMRQAKELVKRVNVIQKDKPALRKKWKLVAFLVGLNDQFNACNGYKSSLLYYDFYVREIINYLRQNLEYVIIDVMSMWDLDGMVELSSKHPNCMNNNRQTMFKKMCSCPFDKKKGEEFRKGMKAYQVGQNKILKTIVEEYQNGTAWTKKEKLATSWLGKPSTFKLIYDPGAENMDLTALPYTSLTNTDCSHPTMQMHERLASSFWKNLFLSSKDKMTDQSWAFKSGYLKFTCPTTIKFD